MSSVEAAPAPTRLLWTCVAVAVLPLALTVFLVVVTTIELDSDSTASLGYAIAFVVGAPTLVGLLLTAVAFALRRSRPGGARVMAIIGLVVLVLPLALSLLLGVNALAESA